MRIGIDVRDLGSSIVGVGKTILDMLIYFRTLTTDDTYVLYHGEITNPLCLSIFDPYEGVPHMEFRQALIPVYAYWQEQIYFGARSVLDTLDIFHAPIHVPPLYVSKKTKIVFTVHDLHSEYNPELFPPRMNAYFRGRRAHAIKKADAVIVHTEFVKKGVLEHCGVAEKKVHLVPCAVSPDHLESVNEEEKSHVKQKYTLPDNFILYVGSIEPWKQVSQLIDYFHAYQKKSGDDISLVLVGRLGWKESLGDEVRQKIASYGNVAWLDYVPQEDLPAIYSCARLFTSASQWEGFGLIFVEAMAHGLPILAANRSAVPEVVGNAGLLFESNNSDEYVEKLEQLLHNKALFEQIQENARRRVSQFGDSTTYGKAVHDVYEQVMG